LKLIAYTLSLQDRLFRTGQLLMDRERRAKLRQCQAERRLPPRALPPLPFPREELKKDLPFIHPRNESRSKPPDSASTRLPEFATFLEAENAEKPDPHDASQPLVPTPSAARPLNLEFGVLGLFSA
jgi:hypothetical protein